MAGRDRKSARDVSHQPVRGEWHVCREPVRIKHQASSPPMNNFAVARVFSRIADLMEIKGENFHKIRAYRGAAQTMQELTESLEVLAERGALQTIPGVGE